MAGLPYRDFVLLHPPGIMLALAPFAAVGRLTADHVGFVLAGLAFTGIGAVNARPGLGDRTQAGNESTSPRSAPDSSPPCGSDRSGLSTSVGSSRLANLFVLLGLYGLRRPPAAGPPDWSSRPDGSSAGHGHQREDLVRRAADRRGGLGCASGPPTASARWLSRPGRPSPLLAIDGPFFALAPSQMWHMVITDQLGRTRSNVSPLTRLDQTVDFTAWHRALGRVARRSRGDRPAVALVGLIVSAGRRPGGRVLVVLLAVQVLVLAAAPSWFSFYSDYLTPALAVIGGARTGRCPARNLAGGRGDPAPAHRTTASVRHRLGRGRARAVRAACAGNASERRFPQVTLAAAGHPPPCVMSDSPMALIELDALSRSFSPGCRDWVDITGRTYGADRMNVAAAEEHPVAARHQHLPAVRQRVHHYPRRDRPERADDGGVAPSTGAGTIRSLRDLPRWINRAVIGPLRATSGPGA